MLGLKTAVCYFFLLLARVGAEAVLVSLFSLALVGSGSSGAGGGVVSIVHPIHPEITKTSKTKSRTGIPTAHSYQYFGSPTKGAKNAAR